MDGCDVHVDLAVLLPGAGEGAVQPVPVRKLPDGTYLVLFSPGQVQGIAAGDVIRLSNRHKGAFDVVSRGGNVSLQVFRREGIRPVLEWLLPRLTPLSGRLDGSVERGAVFTIPVASGFTSIEQVMDGATTAFPGIEWYYGNVYAEDGETPLNWWQPGSTGC